MKRLWLSLALLLGGSLHPIASIAAEDPPPGNILEQLGGLGDMGGFGAGEGNELTLTGEFQVEPGGQNGVLKIKGVLASGWHTYDVAQKGGPGPSKITVNAPGKLELTGPFKPEQEPHSRTVPVFDVPLLEHYGEVVWTAPVRLAVGVDPAKLELDVKFDGQACHDKSGCKPIFGQAIPVKFAGYAAAVASPGTPPQPAEKVEPKEPEEPEASAASASAYRASRTHVIFRGGMRPATVGPGGKVRLTLRAACDDGWHIYAYAARDPQQVAKPTLVVLTEPAGWELGPPQVSDTPTVKQTSADEPPVSFHEGQVTWAFEVRVPENVKPGSYNLSGMVGYQTCTEKGCDPPAGAVFSALVTVTGSPMTAGPGIPLAFKGSTYAAVAESAAGRAAPERSQPQAAEPATTSFAMALVLAFVGGLVLNVMPCVLPVIGLKIMAFVQQSGESRGRILALNVWYSLGLLSVFMVLAALAVVWNVGWGQHFQSETFRITMAVVVFTMGLSFLGVWEIPIPGFMGSGKASELAEREGPVGAFAKGIVTTLLATPCSGPGLATAWAWCSGKPPGMVYTVFAAMGLGMASPYLLIGINPKLIRFLPKPGMWMETFKQIMGFVLMGTVIYLFSFMRWTAVVPTLALLFACWAACWWIGRIEFTATFPAKLRAWLTAIAFACLIGLYAFGDHVQAGGYKLLGLRGMMESRMAAFLQAAKDKPLGERITELAKAHQTVMVDFTADWCLTCKALETSVLNTDEIQQALKANGVVTIVADWTNPNDEISRILDSLGSRQVPVLAIYPAGKPQEPLILRGLYTKADLLEKLREAGPSQGVRGQ